MQRYLVGKERGASRDEEQPEAVQTSKRDEQRAAEKLSLFGSAIELQVRAIISTLEIAEGGKAKIRAGALLQRLRAMYAKGFQSRDELGNDIIMVESALVTFLPDGYEDEEIEHIVEGQDKEFVEYWWRMLARHLPTAADALGERKPSSSWQLYTTESRAAQPLRDREPDMATALKRRKTVECTQLDPEEVHAADQEKALAESLEQDSQDSLDKVEVDAYFRAQLQHDRVKDAAVYRENELCEFQEKMKEKGREWGALQDEVRVCLQARCLSAEGEAGTPQTITRATHPDGDDNGGKIDY